MTFETNVFYNCPFDKDYKPILEAVVFCLKYLQLTPLLASQENDGGESRVDKICRLIASAKYGIHDLSRIRAKKRGEIFRLNMPFELGIDFGARRLYSEKYGDKSLLILGIEPFRYQAALSDLAGSDIRSHAGRATDAVEEVRNWFSARLPGETPGPSMIWGRYNDFRGENYIRLTERDFNNAQISRLPISELMSDMDDCCRIIANIGFQAVK
ncbi:hypothetical protein [Hyphobacterium sp.]|uniref:hypothetical protein n=1 Tax=Hyphobacterium sp. TaxID=2004662 RepID=UPI003BA99FA7